MLARFLAAIVLCLAAACERAPTYSQATPEATIATARLMVQRSDTRRLSTLIFADSPDMRGFLDKLGVLLANTQKLAAAVEKRFPADVAEIKKQAQESAESGKVGALIGDMARQVNSRQRQWDPKADEARQRGFEDVAKQFFADPYGWLLANEGRLTTEYLTDDSVSLRWDGKPILAPLGIQMRKAADEKWYFVLPLNIPGVQRYMPRTKQEWDIFGSMVAVVNNTIVDLRKDVEAGKVQSMNDLSRQAGEKAFLPAAMVFVAYSKAVENRKKDAPAN